MIRIKIKATGAVQEVTRNVAHDLIDRGLATLLPSAGIKTGDRQESGSSYLNRQMRTSRGSRQLRK